MLFPRTGSEISSEWLQMVIESYEKSRRSIVNAQIDNFDITKGTNPGENFNSELIRVKLEGKIHTEETEEDVQYDLILKFHSLSIFAKEVNIYNKNHIKELDIYSKIHKELTELQEKELNGKYKLNIPELIYGHNIGEDYVIAMRNLKPIGYVLNDKTLGLNLEQLKLAVNQVARWHALSYVCNERNKLLERFPLLNLDRQNLEFLLIVIEITKKNVYSLFTDRSEWKDFFQRLKNTNEIVKKLRTQFTNDQSISGRIYTLVHGDYWNNNLLYNYSNQENSDVRNPSDICVVDWQMCHWDRSVIDLQYLLYSSTSYEVRRNHLNEILLEYFTVFNDIVSTLSTPVPDMTFESFKSDFKESSIIGFFIGLCYSQGTLSKAGESVSLPNSSATNVRGFAYTLKTKMARFLTSMMISSISFVLKAAFQKMFKPIEKEIKEGKNGIMMTRLSGLIQEAIDNGTLDDISPVNSTK